MRLCRQFAQCHFGMFFGIALGSECRIAQTWTSVLALKTGAFVGAVKAAAGFVTKSGFIAARTAFAVAAIARSTGTEAGFVTASAAAGITLAIAGCMTGPDLGKVEQLPDTTGMKNEVVIQIGHLTGYGASVDQAIRLAGAACVPVGNVTDVLAKISANKGFNASHASSD